LQINDSTVALVTGGASGLGGATVRRLHADGAAVVILDLPSSPGEALAAELGERARFVATDLRQFELASTFDLIVLADDPMAHLLSDDDRAKVSRLITDHLAPGGRVVIEGLYRHKPVQTAAESWTPTGVPFVWRARYRYENAEVTARLRSWSRQEVELLPDAGIRIESIWGDFDERPFRDDSERMILVGAK